MHTESPSQPTGPGAFAIVSLIICLKLYLAMIPSGFQYMIHLPVPYWKIVHEEEEQ
jgi:hypothetical protein